MSLDVNYNHTRSARGVVENYLTIITTKNDVEYIDVQNFASAFKHHGHLLCTSIVFKSAIYRFNKRKDKSRDSACVNLFKFHLFDNTCHFSFFPKEIIREIATHLLRINTTPHIHTDNKYMNRIIENTNIINTFQNAKMYQDDDELTEILVNSDKLLKYYQKKCTK
jgi:hypothetical protein